MIRFNEWRMRNEGYNDDLSPSEHARIKQVLSWLFDEYANSDNPDKIDAGDLSIMVPSEKDPHRSELVRLKGFRGGLVDDGVCDAFIDIGFIGDDLHVMTRYQGSKKLAKGIVKNRQDVKKLVEKTLAGPLYR